MADIEKVTKGLQYCTKTDGNQCPKCPYFDGECTEELSKDALELLKEQDKLLRKKQKDIDKLCCDIADLKHRFHEKTEIVRCKDCKKCDLPEEKPYEDGYCSRCGYVKMDWFCADGEREET